MTYTIVQVTKDYLGIRTEVVKSFETKDRATRFLTVLAKKHQWLFKPGVILDKYIDQDDRIYYVREENK